MDRVLLAIDDIQYIRQAEIALRKLGFEVETVNNEFNVSKTLLSFNPDYVIVRGQSTRLNTLNVAKKLKESHLKSSKVILIFPQDFAPSSDDFFSIKAELMLHEPVSTLRLALYLVSIAGLEMSFVREKLLKFAITDPQFRTNEQQILKTAGVTVDAEIDLISNLENFEQLMQNSPGQVIVQERLASDDEFFMAQQPTEEVDDSGGVIIENSNATPNFSASDNPVTGAAAIEDDNFVIPNEGETEEFVITDDIKQRLMDEVHQVSDELPLRIDSYNRSIGNFDQDLRKGLSKRQTKKELRNIQKALFEENKVDKNSQERLDLTRRGFAKALFKK